MTDEIEMKPGESTLTTGNYSIEMSGGALQIFTIDANGGRVWIANAGDPQTAMDIVEGLILVETKRFYHPDTTPTFEDKPEETAPVPPFLKR